MISTRLAARIRRHHPRRHEPAIEEIEELGMLLGPARGAVIIVAALVVITAAVAAVIAGLVVRLLHP